MIARRLLVSLLAISLMSGCTVVAPAISQSPSPTAKPYGGPRTNPYGTIILAAGTVVATGSLTSLQIATRGNSASRSRASC